VSDDERITLDEQRAASFVGKHVLFGLTFTDDNGRVLDMIERHGTVEYVDAEAGIGVRLTSEGNEWDGELYALPPDLDAFEQAQPGIYHLHSTDEDVEYPDFTASWTIRDE
jgi:hypothetical protein